MGNTINNIRMNQVGSQSVRQKNVGKQTSEKEQVVSDSFTPSAEETQTARESTPQKSNTQIAKDFIHSALKKIEAAKPDMVEAGKDGEDADKVLEDMTGNIKAIHMDFQSDVSNEGKIVRDKGKKATGEMDEGKEDVTKARKDLEGLDKDIDGALNQVKKEIKSNKSKFLYGAEANLKQAKEYYDWAMREVDSVDRGFKFGQKKVQDMGPYLDRIEKDTVDLDVGRFAEDLKGLKGDAREQLISVKIGSEFGNKRLDDVKGYLEKALKYLK